MEPPIFVMFSLCLVFTYSENLIHLALTIQKLKILAIKFQENPQFWYPKIFSDFIFSSCLPTLKIWCLMWVVKKLQFW